jgi:hypothetical protein
MGCTLPRSNGLMQSKPGSPIIARQYHIIISLGLFGSDKCALRHAPASTDELPLWTLGLKQLAVRRNVRIVEA